MRVLTALCFAFIAPVSLLAQVCAPEWTPGLFAETPGLTGWCGAGTLFDDGTGPSLYVGGSFQFAGTERVNRVAKWDGSRWSRVGDGFDSTVNSLLVFDDGGGASLYAGGSFSHSGDIAVSGVAQWDGVSWIPLAAGFNGSVFELCVHDDGMGEKLYAGGSFTTIDGNARNRIAKWNGESWEELGVGLDSGDVYALTSFQPPGSATPLLIAGGTFMVAGGLPASRIASWDGSQWAAFGSGVVGGSLPGVDDLLSFDPGSGATLYISGNFAAVDGVPAASIARWNGAEWSQVGGGLSGVLTSGFVNSLSTYDDGAGTKLYAGGLFTRTSGGTVVLSHIARLNGNAWENLAGGGVSNTVGIIVPNVNSEDPSRSRLFAGGYLTNNCIQWDGAQWSNLGGGTDGGMRALAEFDDGTGPALYAGGNFNRTGNTPALRIARWSMSQGWSSVGGGIGVGVTVNALHVHDFGAGPSLYVGGRFDSAGGLETFSIANWDGMNWHALGTGIRGDVWALASYDDGTGPALFVGGTFTHYTGPGNLIAKWDGTSWSPLGTGLDAPNISPISVNALTVFDDGAGPQLYAAGRFRTAGGINVGNIARWNGSAWSALQGDTGGSSLDEVKALAIYPPQGNSELYAGGSFQTAGIVSAPCVARWNGAAWNKVGEGFNNRVLALRADDDGTGIALFASGQFVRSGDIPLERVARWDGQQWTAVGGGSSGFPYAITSVSDAGGRGLYFGGDFSSCGGELSRSVARWGPPFPIIGDLNSDCRVDVSDLASLLASFALCEQDPNFNSSADLDHDACITIGDLTLLLSHFGL